MHYCYQWFYIFTVLYISLQPTLGVIRANEAKLFVLVGPVGPYYPTGMAPVKLLADPKFVRAWPGGSGGFKMGWWV